jgi:hypothetical protein
MPLQLNNLKLKRQERFLLMFITYPAFVVELSVSRYTIIQFEEYRFAYLQ